MTDLFNFFKDELPSQAEKLSATYQGAEPFPHIVIDNFLPKKIANKILRRFPKANNPDFKQRLNFKHYGGKLGSVQNSRFANTDPWLRQTLFEFNTLGFLDFLETLTGLEGLIPDPHFSGGAFHQIINGGKLDIHADFSSDRRRILMRRLNVLIYFNKNWKPEYEGDLELWSPDMKTRAASIAPVFNRCVIFNTTRTSYHGHPVPMKTPPNITRKSIALYYYNSDQQAFDPDKNHKTLWQERPDQFKDLA